MLGLKDAQPHTVKLSTDFSFQPPLTYFLPVHVSSGNNAELLAEPCPANNSGDYSSIIKTDGFIVLPAEDKTNFKKGEIFEYYEW